MSKNHLRAKTAIGIIIGAILAIIITTASSMQTFAVSESTLMKKTLLNALRTCYSSAYMTDGPVTGSAFKTYGIDTLLTDAGKTDQVVLVPTKIGNSVDNSQVTCQEVFSGASGRKRGSMTGLLSLFNKNTDNITYFGYTLKDGASESDQQGCISISYKDASAVVHTTDTICFKLKDGKIVNPMGENVITKSTDDGGPVSLWYDSGMGILKLNVQGAVPAWNPQDIAAATSDMSWSNFTSEVGKTLSSGPEWCRSMPDSYCRPIDDAWKYGKDYEPIGLGYTFRSIKVEQNNGEIYEEYVKRGQDVASLRALRYIAGANAGWENEESVKFTKEEAYDLYDAYFQRFKNEDKVFVDADCYPKAEKDKATAGSGYAVYNGSGKWCGVRINTTTDRQEKYNVVNSEYNGLYAATIEEILDKMTKWEFSYTEDPENPPPPGIDPGDDDNGGGSGDFDSDECYDAAGSLGWILCPVLKVVTTATDSIYDDYIQKDFLEVKTTWMDQVYSSWDSIRKIANLLFVIFFVVIVFSQLTGIGLTNYAIKKALPRLVMVVVLVNVSFLICQLAVDLSNILGYTLNAMFDGLAQSGGGGGGGLGAIGNRVMSGLSWAGIAIVAYKTAAFWLIPFLLAALSAIISVVFGALVLGIRQAGVLVLVALAPAAIACYALPNTKSLFDKWSKAFLSLLMVFPICGALVGGGNFAASLILTASDSVLLSVIAMLLRVAPFFFIPSIVKSSLTALGNIGMRVSNFGSRLSHSATGAIARSDAAKYADASLRANRADQIQRSARRRSAFNDKLRNMPGIGGIVTAAEDSALGQKIGASAKGRRDAKIARLYSRSNKLLSDEAAAGGAHRLQRGTSEYDAKVEAARYERISGMARNVQGQYTTVASDLDAIGSMYEQAIQAYENDSSDENLAVLQAMGNMALDNGDPGRALYHNKLGWATEGGYSKSVQAMGQHMLREHVKDIKPVARDTFADTADAAQGKLKAGAFTKGTYTDPRTGKSEEHYVSNKISESVSGYDPSSLLKMDEGAIKRLTIAAKEGKIPDNYRATIDSLTSEALASPRLFAQPKIRDELNDLREGLYLSRIESSAKEATEGPVLRTGNDDRNKS